MCLVSHLAFDFVDARRMGDDDLHHGFVMFIALFFLVNLQSFPDLKMLIFFSH